MMETGDGEALDLLLAEHRTLHATVAELRRHLEQPRPRPDSPEAAAWAGGLAKRLFDFRELARRHFRSEESSGFMEQLARSAPRATRVISKLQTEHDLILNELRAALHAATIHTRDQESECQDVRSLTTAVLERFELHEHSENELIQELVCDDLGVGD